MNTMETSATPQKDEGEAALQKDEGKMTKLLEERTSQLPSGTYLALAVGSMIASAALMVWGRKQLANFVGQWAPALLVIGVYNKIVKLEDELLER